MDTKPRRHYVCEVFMNLGYNDFQMDLLRYVEVWKVEAFFENAKIRNAEKRDIPGVMELLKQVLELHAGIRPDIFVSGKTKYSEEELLDIFSDVNRRTFVAVDEDENVLGYAFCIIREQPASEYMVPFKYLYIDDLCVDSSVRGMHIGKSIFEYVRREASKMGCYEITLNVWNGNESARTFYEKIGMKEKSTQMELIL